jgi:hypothetical protein
VTIRFSPEDKNPARLNTKYTGRRGKGVVSLPTYFGNWEGKLGKSKKTNETPYAV